MSLESITKQNQGRGRKAESGSAIARRHRSKTNEDEGNEAHHVGSGSSENQPGAEKALGKDERSSTETQARNFSSR